MIRIALLRHGHTAWNRAGRIQGRTDVPLDEDAIAQLSTLALPADWPESALWSSPLSRAVDTARLVAGRNPMTDPALTEMNWGDWEGQHAASLYEDPNSDYRHLETWGWHYTPPNGESPDALRARLIPWINARTEDTVTVCHIGVMRVILAMATGWDFDRPAPFQIKRNRLYVVEVTENGLTLQPEPVRLVEQSP